MSSLVCPGTTTLQRTKNWEVKIRVSMAVEGLDVIVGVPRDQHIPWNDEVAIERTALYGLGEPRYHCLNLQSASNHECAIQSAGFCGVGGPRCHCSSA